MLRRETAQKAIICVLLAVVMIALVAIFAVAGLHAPALTAQAENEYKVLLWLADDPSIPFGSYATTNNYKSNIKKHYESIDGVTVVEKVYSSGALTEEEISDVQLVFIIAMEANLDNQDGQYVLAASDMIKDFVDAGGRVVLSGENPNYAAPGNAVSSKLAENIGGNFTITSTMGANQEMLLNTTEKPELVKDIVAENFTPMAYAHIESTNPNAVWVMKDSENKVAVLDQAVGNGYITVITDIDWVDYGISDTSDYTNGRNVANRQFLKNLLVASAENIEKNAPHVHNFSYTANGATITATCSADGCSLTDGKATLTINAPEALACNGNAKEATLSTYDTEVFSPEAIKYYVDGAEVSAENVKDTGTYVARVTSNGATAEVSFTIIEINVVKWELSKVPNEHRVLSRDDMEGFAPTSFEIARQWVPEEDDVGQHVYLIYWCKTSKYDEYNYSFIEFISGEYWLHDDVIDDIPLSEFYRDITNGAFYYYTGVKASSGQDEGSQPAKVAAPAIIQEGESQADGSVLVLLYCETEGATIYYSLDGSIPNEHSAVYSGSPITVPANTTIRAVAMKAGMDESVLAVESFGGSDPTWNGGETAGKGDVAPIVVKETEKAGHGFCVGWVVFIFVMLELLYLALYFILWFPKAAFLLKKCKLTALNDFKNGHILFGVVDMLAFIGLCVSCGVFLFALIALCCHACAVTVVSFILALLVFGAFVAIFVLGHKDLVKSWIDKIFKKEKKEEEPASETEEAPAEEPASTQNDQE